MENHKAPKRQYTKKLRSFEVSPYENPLLVPDFSVPVKQAKVFTRLDERRVIDAETGEAVGMRVSQICRIEEKDQAQFVKVFSEGVAAMFGLSKTAQRVFMAILQIYEQTPMTNGYADSLYLHWFDGGLSGQSMDMSEATYSRGLLELLEKRFIAPRSPNLFWVNPALFFKGDRVAFVKEYRRRPTATALPVSPAQVEDNAQLELPEV